MVHNVLANPDIEQPFYTIIAELLSKASNRNVRSLALVCIYVYPSHLHAQEDSMFLHVLISVTLVQYDASVDSALHLAQ